MKTILCLTLACVATAHAQYSSGGSTFDSGIGYSESTTAIHRGVFSGWPPQTMQTSKYRLETGFDFDFSRVPAPVPDPGPTVPGLSIRKVGTELRISWPASAKSFALEFNETLAGRATWTSVRVPASSDGTDPFILVPVSRFGGFYRLVLR